MTDPSWVRYQRMTKISDRVGAEAAVEQEAEALIALERHLERYDARNIESSCIVASAPGDGWFVDILNEAGEKDDTCRVIAWTVHENGGMVPCCIEDPESGTTWFPTAAPEFRTRVYHRDDQVSGED